MRLVLVASPTSTAKKPISTSRLNSLPDFIATPDDARGFFWLWFFGGQGGATVALGQFPQLIAKSKALFALSDEGPTAGGDNDNVGVSPLCLYPRDLSKADLDKLLNNELSVVKMVEVGPKPNYLSEQGYLNYYSFVDANKGCNPLSVRAVFDAMSTGDNVSPDAAQAALDSFKDDTSADRSVFKNALLKTRLTGYSSIGFLLFLLGPIVGSTCLDALYAGWFPEWPGGDSMPWSFLIGPGIWTVKDYW
eukprot:CAMPEP_0194191076 /NCGR_PEP_ID=MMETSP0154-20130528/65428_1 /TAXON_ID=1049557 /ORGANISM="Thalassiothrix antarctica, Strain L6-D1" /LENGTH=248 /DNA_ID=CAMNT_0038913461 /DNA_START=242 /DNA_END=985 /DNA_ORIENTATION=-